MNTETTRPRVPTVALLRPDRGLLRPLRVAIAFGEFMSGCGERGGVTTCLVFRYAFPILRFRGRVGLRVPLYDFAEATLGISKVPFAERGVANTKQQLRQKIFNRQETLDAMPLVAIVIEEENRRRPQRTVARTQLLELIALFSRVHADGNKVVLDEFGHAGIRIHLGIQPSTSCSHWCRAEVEKNVTLLSARLRERPIKIVRPRNRFGLNRHCSPPGPRRLRTPRYSSLSF